MRVFDRYGRNIVPTADDARREESYVTEAISCWKDDIYFELDFSGMQSRDVSSKITRTFSGHQTYIMSRSSGKCPMLVGEVRLGLVWYPIFTKFKYASFPHRVVQVDKNPETLISVYVLPSSQVVKY